MYNSLESNTTNFAGPPERFKASFANSSRMAPETTQYRGPATSWDRKESHNPRFNNSAAGTNALAVGSSYNGSSDPSNFRTAPQHKKQNNGKERFKYVRCTRKRAICAALVLVISPLLFGLLFFRRPLFETDLETLEFSEFNLGSSLSFAANFTLIFENTNFLPVTVNDLDCNVTYGDIIVDVAIFEKHFLPARTKVPAPAQISTTIGFAESASSLALINACLSEGIVEFELRAISNGHYLGVTSDLELPPSIFPVDCGALLNGGK